MTEGEADDESVATDQLDICSICLDEDVEKNPVDAYVHSKTGCRHLFHKKCVMQWFERADNSSTGSSPDTQIAIGRCPMCTTPVCEVV